MSEQDYEWNRVNDLDPPVDRALIIADEGGFGEMGYWDGMMWRNNESGSLRITPFYWRKYLPPNMSVARAEGLFQPIGGQ